MMFKKTMFFCLLTPLSLCANEPITDDVWQKLIPQLASEAVDTYYRLLPEAYSHDSTSGTLILYRKGCAYKTVKQKAYGQYEDYFVNGPSIDLLSDMKQAVKNLKSATTQQRKLIFQITQKQQPFSRKKQKAIQTFTSPALSAYLLHVSDKSQNPTPKSQ